MPVTICMNDFESSRRLFGEFLVKAKTLFEEAAHQVEDSSLCVLDPNSFRANIELWINFLAKLAHGRTVILFSILVDCYRAHFARILHPPLHIGKPSNLWYILDFKLTGNLSFILICLLF